MFTVKAGTPLRKSEPQPELARDIHARPGLQHLAEHHLPDRVAQPFRHQGTARAEARDRRA